MNPELAEAVRVLKRGGVIAFPTETSYGLGCDPLNERAVKKIFNIKSRDAVKSLPLIANSVTQVKRAAKLAPEVERFAREYWPGPLTLALPARERFAPGVAKDGEIAIRVSGHPLARALARKLDRPIVATSLNLSGEAAIFDMNDLDKRMRKGIDAILNTGPLPPSRPSTIVRFSGGKMKVIRPGVIKL